SQAVEVNGTLYISGQVPIDPATGKIVEGGITEQTTQALKNIKAILTAAGYSLNDVVKSTCLLSDMSDFKAMNEVYAQFYTSDQPARAAFAVKGLPLGALIEIETVAAK
ncbi:MAG: Rid family detoxifying hydrolase, partial [Bacteroidales bacterium]|nr:Rid family detoxifying hydrolase [Bacteroidales bacterium]